MRGGDVPGCSNVGPVTKVGWRRLVLAAVAALGVAMIPSCSLTQHDESAPAGDVANLKYTLKDMNGQEVNLASFKGKPIVLNFWATWCGPCKVEIPIFVALTEQYRAQELTILGVSVDDSPEDLRKFAAEYKMNYPVLVGLGHDEFQEKYDAMLALPITWFIRADGTIMKRHLGPASKEWFETQVKALIAPAKPEAD